MFDSAVWPFSRVMTMENFAFMLGSSKQGKAFLASVGSNWVVARYLEQDSKHQTFLATSDNSICKCLWSVECLHVWPGKPQLDCEQSLFFLQLATRVRERRAAKPRDTRRDSQIQKTSSALKIVIIWQKRLHTQLHYCGILWILLIWTSKNTKETCTKLSYFTETVIWFVHL